MDFFRSQRDARRQTLVFLASFILIVALVVVLTSVFVWLGCSLLSPENRFTYASNTALVVVLIIIGASIVRSMELRSGGGAVIARHLGGEPLPASRMDNSDFQRLRNIAEEMAIASRTPMPKLYWLPGEASINAFVAGFTPSDAVLAVTRGALQRLNRDELQGVIAHEFSHLLNGDMRLNTQVSSWLFGVYAVYTYGRSILKTSPLATNREDLVPRPAAWPLVFVFGGALAIIGYLGKLIGCLLQAAISRQREYLADASAVQFTRQTMGLASALKKIYFNSSLLQTPQGDAYNHFFLGDAVETSPLFATHPPLIERIQALDPSFNPYGDQRATLGANLDVDALHQALPLYFAADSGASVSEYETAFTMRDGLALLFANLLDTGDETVRRRQLETIDNTADEEIAQIKERAATEGKLLREQHKANIAALEAYAAYYREELFKDRKSLERPFGTFGYRKAPDAIHVSKETAELLKQAGLEEYLRVKVEPDKEAMLALTDETLAEVRASRRSREDFFIETKREQVNQDLAKQGA